MDKPARSWIIPEQAFEQPYMPAEGRLGGDGKYMRMVDEQKMPVTAFEVNIIFGILQWVSSSLAMRLFGDTMRFNDGILPATCNHHH